MKKKNKSIEIIFVSQDRSEQDCLAYFAGMPWLAAPYFAPHIPKNPNGGIPSLVLYDRYGDIITKQGREQVLEDPSGDWIEAYYTSKKAAAAKREEERIAAQKTELVTFGLTAVAMLAIGVFVSWKYRSKVF